MSSAFWLLLYLAPLLGITAALFAWFGWQWRGSDLLKRVDKLQNEAGNEREIRVKAESERDALKNELQPALEAARRHEDDAAKARESLQALETESSRLLRDLDLLRAERDQHAAALQTARDELEQLRAATAASEAPANEVPAAASAPPVEKPKRKRATTAKAQKQRPQTPRLAKKSPRSTRSLPRISPPSLRSPRSITTGFVESANSKEKHPLIPPGWPWHAVA